MNQRGSTLLYVLVLLLVLTGGLGYYILNNQSQFNLTFSTNNTQNIVVPKETSITSKSPTPSLDISDWKTYTNQLDFENKYPQTWDYYKLGDNDIAFGPTELVKANSIQLNNPNVGALIGGKAWPIEVKPLNGNLYYYGPNQIPFTSNETEKVSSQQLIIDGINTVTYTIVFSEDAP